MHINLIIAIEKHFGREVRRGRDRQHQGRRTEYRHARRSHRAQTLRLRRWSEMNVCSLEFLLAVMVVSAVLFRLPDPRLRQTVLSLCFVGFLCTHIPNLPSAAVLIAFLLSGYACSRAAWPPPQPARPRGLSHIPDRGVRLDQEVRISGPAAPSFDLESSGGDHRIELHALPSDSFRRRLDAGADREVHSLGISQLPVERVYHHGRAHRAFSSFVWHGHCPPRCFATGTNCSGRTCEFSPVWSRSVCFPPRSSSSTSDCSAASSSRTQAQPRSAQARGLAGIHNVCLFSLYVCKLLGLL